ncbi:polyprenyl synthetase family protein [Lagierella sp. ICN-221743]
MNNFIKEYDLRKDIVNKGLEKIFTYKNILEDGSFYALMNNGKRFRPILFIEFYSLFKEVDESCMDFAYAIELIHNYSLVHDDLPCMDDDDMRRGKPTVHKKYGEDMGVLIGDGLLNKSMERILMAILNSDNKELFVEASKYLYSQSGYEGMIYGQVLDIQNKLETKSDFFDMYDKKTCGLIKAACKCAAITAGATEEEVELSEKFGYNFGLAFQLRDDMLDYEEDLESQKLTFATLIKNKEEMSKTIEEHSKNAMNCLKSLNKNTEFLEDLTNNFINRDI